jgi:hypothetical protein
LACGVRVGALRIGDDAKAIRRAWECASGRGDIYRQTGHDPVIAIGLDAMAARYELPRGEL